jgi:hypothetical protein
MKSSHILRGHLIALAFVGLMLAPGQTFAQAKKPFTAGGVWVEGCSCAPPCACEMIGPNMECQGVGFMDFKSGKYMGTSLAGAKMAYGVGVGKWVRIYIDAKSPKQYNAVKALSTSVFKGFGPLEGVRKAKISVTGSKGKYTCTADGGSLMALTTKPVIGGDKKTPLVYSNINNPLHSTVMQGKVVGCSFKDGEHEFDLKDTNAFFNPAAKGNGKI